jgi:hypothetical protein
MIIELVDVATNTAVMRYESEIVPRAGESVSRTENEREWQVQNVDHLVGGNWQKPELITLAVRKI